MPLSISVYFGKFLNKWAHFFIIENNPKDFLLLIYYSITDNIFGLQSSGKSPKNEGGQNVKEITSEVKKPDGGNILGSTV